MEYIVTGTDENITKRMLSLPKTDISKLIGQKWFLTLEKLSERTGVSVSILEGAVEGQKIHISNERKIRRYLENYKGECTDTAQNKGVTVGSWLRQRRDDEAEANKLGMTFEEYRACIYGKKGGK